MSSLKNSPPIDYNLIEKQSMLCNLIYDFDKDYSERNVFHQEATRLGYNEIIIINKEGFKAACLYNAKEGEINIVFRGTDSVQGQVYNTQDNLVNGPFNKGKNMVFEGFWKNFFLNTDIDDEIINFINKKLLVGANAINITGHSQGAALSVLMSTKLFVNYSIKAKSVMLFGAPMCGDGGFQEIYNRNLKDVTFNFMYDMDIVPRILLLPYQPVGILYQYSPINNSLKQLTEEEYGAIRIYYHAAFPSKIIQEAYKKMPYIEFLQTMLDAPDHLPQNYANMGGELTGKKGFVAEIEYELKTADQVKDYVVSDIKEALLGPTSKVQPTLFRWCSIV